MNLYLIGYRGCGKSTVAPLVAQRLGWKYVDTDDFIEMAGDMSIAEIFLKRGEAEFRFRETDAIAGFAALSNVVVSLGGGAPISESNRELIATSGKAVWLNADPETLWQRISADASSVTRRPDLTDSGGKAEVVELLAVRYPVYESCSDFTIEVDGLSPEEVAEYIVQWWETVDV